MTFIVSALLNAVVAMLLKGLAYAFDFFGRLLEELFGSDTMFFEQLFKLSNGSGETSQVGGIFLSVFRTIGLAFCIALLILALIKNVYSGFGLKGDHPLKLVFRFFFSVGFVYTLGMMMKYLFCGLFSAIYQSIKNINILEITGTSEGDIFGGMITNIVSLLTNSWLMILYLLVLIAILVNYVKLLLEMIERYLMCNLLIFFSPLAAPTFVSEDTSKIFFTYIKMFFGQSTIMLLNAVTLKLLSMGLSGAGNIVLKSSTTGFMALMALLAFMKIAQRMDNYLRDLGVTVGITGGNLLGEAMAGMGAVKAILGAGGKGGKGFAGGASGEFPGGMASGLVGRAAMFMRGVTQTGSVLRSTVQDHANGQGWVEAFRANSDANKQARTFTNTSMRAGTKQFGSASMAGMTSSAKFADGNFAMQNSDGDWILRTQEAQNGVYSRPIQDANGDTWYETNMSRENAAYAAQHGGKDMPEYQSFIAATNAGVGATFSGEQVNTAASVLYDGASASASIVGFTASGGGIALADGSMAQPTYTMTTEFQGAEQTVSISPSEYSSLQGADSVPISINSVQYGDQGQISGVDYTISVGTPVSGSVSQVGGEGGASSPVSPGSPSPSGHPAGAGTSTKKNHSKA